MSKLLIVQAEIQLIRLPTSSNVRLQLVLIFHRFRNQSASFTEKRGTRAPIKNFLCGRHVFPGFAVVVDTG